MFCFFGKLNWWDNDPIIMIQDFPLLLSFLTWYLIVVTIPFEIIYYDNIRY